MGEALWTIGGWVWAVLSTVVWWENRHTPMYSRPRIVALLYWMAAILSWIMAEVVK